MSFKAKLEMLGGIVVLCVAWTAIYRVWAYMPIVGMVLLACICAASVLGVAYFFVIVVRKARQPHIVHIERYGTVVVHPMGKSSHHAPSQIAIAASTNSNVVDSTIAGTSITTMGDMPRLGELIRDGALFREEDDKVLMLQGIRSSGEYLYGEWPGVIGVAGMQNTGKSVTIANIAIISLLQGARVTVIDTHHMKPRSLYKKLQPLEGYITFAKTEQEASKQAFLFKEQLDKRKQGSEAYTSILVIDELASLVRSSIGDNLVPVIERASQEGHGFNLHMVLAIHDFSQEGLGDVRIRDMLNYILCHKMSAGQSKFIDAFNTSKTKKDIASLQQGHVYIRDACNDVDADVIMPFCDISDAKIARAELGALTGQIEQNITKMLPEAAWEAVGNVGNLSSLDENSLEPAREAVGNVGTHTEIDETTLNSVLRHIGKRLSKGETLESIRLSLGATKGRNATEIKMALSALGEITEHE